MLQIAEYAKKIQAIKQRAAEALDGTGFPYTPQSSAEDAISLVFVGQYSAGKSTIISMLTGRDDIAIGAGITTENTGVYDWNGIRVIDTPGIHTEQRPDHDEISYRAIAAADILVFVVTSQMFDANIANHFRTLAIDRDKAGEMMLVVNKMQMTAGGNTPAQQEIIRGDIAKVIAPYKPGQLHLCFLDAKSYLDGTARMQSAPERARRLIERSGYAEFERELDAFMREKSLSARLTTDLYQIEELIQKALDKLEDKSDNEDINALEENFTRQRRTISDSRARLKTELLNIFLNAANRIREVGIDAATCVTDGADSAELESRLADKMEEANILAADCQSAAEAALQNGLVAVESDIDAMENSFFTMQLKDNLADNYAALPENVQAILRGTESVLKELSGVINGSALNLGAVSSDALHEAVLAAGSLIKYKFKPWQAVKIAGKIEKAGQVLGVLGVALDIGMQLKEELDEEKRRHMLQEFRRNVRSQFNEFAAELSDFGRSYIESCLNQPLESPLNDLDDKIDAIRTASGQRSEQCDRLRSVLEDCRRLIAEIHKAA